MMADQTLRDRLLDSLDDSEAFCRYITDRLTEAILSHPDYLAEQREYEEWEDKVINGDPSGPPPQGVMRA